jgi:hypothetical protein
MPRVRVIAARSRTPAVDHLCPYQQHCPENRPRQPGWTVRQEVRCDHQHQSDRQQQERRETAVDEISVSQCRIPDEGGDPEETALDEGVRQRRVMGVLGDGECRREDRERQAVNGTEHRHPRSEPRHPRKPPQQPTDHFRTRLLTLIATVLH